MSRTLAFVLAGGEGKRLQPLTRVRSKPSVHFGGSYRLVDFALSNLVNSGINRIQVLTQYRSTSLVRHLHRAWPTNALFDSYVEVVPAAMNRGPTWFRGTADAIWQNIDLLRDTRPEDVAIFGADHIYKMDVSLMLKQHHDSNAALTVAAVPVPRSQASGFGCLAVDENWRITNFVEKPKDPPCIPGRPDTSLVSMGNYIFKAAVLVDELRRDAATSTTKHDFGHDILATAHSRMDVFAYDFTAQLCPGESEHGRGYWRDVGTLDSYFDASMDLVAVEPMLDLYNELWPIRGVQPLIGPAKFVFSDDTNQRTGMARDSIVAAGAILSGSRVERSIISTKAHLHSYSQVRESVLFPGVDVGRGAKLSRCIVDREVKVPPGFDLDRERDRFTCSDTGIAVLTREDFDQMDEFDLVEPKKRATGIDAFEEGVLGLDGASRRAQPAP
jgi:glucose-1-phosphate adenylyltransferase